MSSQHLYRDFFFFSGPGTPWLLAAVFEAFGSSLVATHTLLCIEIGLITSSIYCIVAKSTNRVLAVAGASAFLALLIIAFPHRLYINHRWDSCCCTALAVALLTYWPKKRVLIGAAGLLTGLAAVFTPPAALVALGMGAALLTTAAWKRNLLVFASAAAIPILLAGAVLADQASWQPMLDSLRWVSEHYARANQVPYGFRAETIHPNAEAEPFWHKLLIEIPAVIPVIALAACGFLAAKRKEFSWETKLLITASVGSLAACYPRLVANQLLFALPLFWCLLFVLARNTFTQRSLRAGSLCLAGLSVLSILLGLSTQNSTMPVRTQLGSFECERRDQQNIEFATAAISPGESLFVYPYQPIWYSLTGGINPTCFNFLQPGMMTLEDEANALNQLAAHPPEWVLLHGGLSPRAVLSAWPHSDPATLRFQRIEQFIRRHCAQVQPTHANVRYPIAIFHRIR